MPPIRELSTWNERKSDSHDKIEPARKYVFICEGQSTENRYFNVLVNNVERLELHRLVDVRQWEKTDNDSGRSDPKALIEFAHAQKDDASLNYNRDLDRMVIVFDVDIYCRVGEGRTGAAECRAKYEEILGLKEPDDIYAVTNPSFELFLMLHRKGAYQSIVLPNEQKLLENRKVSRSQRYAQKLFTDNYGINPKSNPDVGELAHDISIAIEEERNLNHDIERCLDQLTSNVAATIDEIKHYKPDIERVG